MQPQDDTIDDLALAYKLIAMHSTKRKGLRKLVEIMADGKKRTGLGVVLIGFVAVLTVGAAIYYHVLPSAFVSIFIGGAITAFVLWAIFRKIL